MNEDEIQLHTVRLLTEHFGFQPITVIDDIINVINEIMYRCTEQLEQILINQKIKIDESINEKLKQQRNDDIIVDMKNSSISDNNNDNNNKYSIEDIQTGTATLESYLEHNINRNFDKFEIYSLRNIFNIPEDLIRNGLIRLKHHKGLKIFENNQNNNNNNNINQIDKQINELMIEKIKEIQYEIALNKILCENLPKLEKLNKLSKMIKIKLNPLIKSENKKILTQLLPLNDTIIFLVSQLKDIYNKINSIKDLINDEKLSNKFLKGSQDEENLNKRIDIIVQRVTKVKGEEKEEAEEKEKGELCKINDISGQNIIDFFSNEDGNIV